MTRLPGRINKQPCKPSRAPPSWRLFSSQHPTTPSSLLPEFCFLQLASGRTCPCIPSHAPRFFFFLLRDDLKTQTTLSRSWTHRLSRWWACRLSIGRQIPDVPRTVVMALLKSRPSSFASPKSDTFRRNHASNTTFCGLMPQWMMRSCYAIPALVGLSCRYVSPLATPMAIYLMFQGRTPSSEIRPVSWKFYQSFICI